MSLRCIGPFGIWHYLIRIPARVHLCVLYRLKSYLSISLFLNAARDSENTWRLTFNIMVLQKILREVLHIRLIHLIRLPGHLLQLEENIDRLLRLIPVDEVVDTINQLERNRQLARLRLILNSPKPSNSERRGPSPSDNSHCQLWQ